MLIASWNVNSIRTRLPQVINWINEVNPDILCLQETKVIDSDFPKKPFEDIGYEVNTYGQKSYNGVAIISKDKQEYTNKGFAFKSKDNFSIEEFDKQKRIISAIINGLRIVNVYVPNGSSLNSDKFEYKLRWLKELSVYLEKLEENGELICLLGDFNIASTNLDIHDPKKYEGGLMASEVERRSLETVIKGRFMDCFRIFEKNTGHWSWWDYRNNAYELNKGWRIDHIYISNNLVSRLKSCVIDRSQRENNQPSDHAPVMINLETVNPNDDYTNEDEDLFEI